MANFFAEYPVKIVDTGSGPVDGPVSSTDKAIATWNGTGGNLLQDNPAFLLSGGEFLCGGDISLNGASSSADLIWNAANGCIGVNFTQTSPTPDVRPKKQFVKEAIIVGSPGGAAPYGQNNALVTGVVVAANQTNVTCVMGSNAFWNSVAMGAFSFIKDGAGANAPAFINLDSSGDQNVYFSLLHRTSTRADYLKFGTGDLTFMQASGANLLWDTAGGGSIGALAASQPAGVHALSTASVGGVKYQTTQATVNTTDDTLTTLQTFATTTDTSLLVEAKVTARRTGGASGSAGDSSVFIMYAMVKNIAGTVTVNGLTPIYTSQDQAWLSDIAVSGTNFLIRVTGAIANNVTWNTTTITQQV